LAGAVALLTALVCAQGPASAVDGRPYTNPLKSFKGADPWLEYYDGNYYLVTTTFTGVLGMRKSPTLAGLATAPNVQIWSDTTPTRNSNTVADSAHHLSAVSTGW
jgi:GH43 family beta-xylosidase